MEEKNTKWKELKKKNIRNIFSFIKLTTDERAKTIGNANALITNPIVMKMDTSVQEFPPLEYEFCAYRRDINVGITENI